MLYGPCPNEATYQTQMCVKRGAIKFNELPEWLKPTLYPEVR